MPRAALQTADHGASQKPKRGRSLADVPAARHLLFKCKNTARKTSPSSMPRMPCGYNSLTAAVTSVAVTDASPNDRNPSSKSACGEGVGDNFLGLIGAAWRR